MWLPKKFQQLKEQSSFHLHFIALLCICPLVACTLSDCKNSNKQALATLVNLLACLLLNCAKKKKRHTTEKHDSSGEEQKKFSCKIACFWIDTGIDCFNDWESRGWLKANYVFFYTYNFFNSYLEEKCYDLSLLENSGWTVQFFISNLQSCIDCLALEHCDNIVAIILAAM